MDKLLESALSQGLGYAMFVFLFLWVLKKQEQRDKKSEEREEKYQGIIQELTSKFNIIEDIKTDVKEIKQHFFK